MRLTGQRVAAVLKKSGVRRGGWTASSRVSGWGRWLDGVASEAVRGFDAKAGGHIRGRDGWQRNWDGSLKTRGAWKNTGEWRVWYQVGERQDALAPDAAEQVGRVAALFEDSGFTVEWASETEFRVKGDAP